MSKTLTILGYYGNDNLGDEAILEGIKQTLINWNKEVKIQVISDYPDKIFKEHDLPGYKQIQPVIRGSFNPIKFFKELRDIRKLIKESRLLIIGGGGLYHDYFTPRPYGTWETFLAKILGKPIILFSVGVGPYETNIGKFFTRIVLNKIDLITVRDEFSKRSLIEMGVNAPSLYIVPDPVLHLDFEKCIETFDLGEEERPLFGVSVRPWFNDKSYKYKIAKMLDNIVVKYNGKIIFIPLHFDRDDKIMYDIRNLMKYKEKALVIDKRYSVFQLMDIIGKMDVIIGMRLHSLIFAAKMNVPFIGLVYDPKVRSLAKKLQMDSYTCDIANLDSRDLLDKVERLLENRGDIKKTISKNIGIIETEAKDQSRIIINEIVKHI